MAEQVRGSFSFTVLDEANNLHIVKGDSPFCLYHYPRQGLYLYCSTEEILQTALAAAGLRLEQPERITLHYGDILQIGSTGALKWEKFCNHDEGGGSCMLHGWRGVLSSPDEVSYLDALKSVARAFGIFPEDIDRLYRQGFAPEEIEDALYSREI